MQLKVLQGQTPAELEAAFERWKSGFKSGRVEVGMMSITPDGRTLAILFVVRG